MPDTKVRDGGGGGKDMTKHERAIEAAKSAYASHYHSGGMEASIAAYHRVMREPGEGEVRVRAVVALDPDGVDYEISGSRAYCDHVHRNVARAALNGEPDADTVQFRWIEANVPAWKPPAEETVEGEVVG